MLEKIYAFVLLLQANLITQAEHINCLNEFFLENPKNEFLIELEFASDNLNKTITLVNEHFFKTKHGLNHEIFGHFLFEKIEKSYRKDTMKIEKFAERAYRLWNLFPNEIAETEPFRILAYADEYLPHDETETRELYEKTFSHKWNF